MKKIKSYTSIWSVEKVIYAINDFQLPFPLTFSQMAWFVLSLFVVILFGELPPLSMIDGAFLKYFGLPVAFTWFVSQKTFDGKKPFGFLKSCISYCTAPVLILYRYNIRMHILTFIPLFYGNRLCQISRLIYITAFAQSYIIAEQLKRNNRQ